MARGGERGQHEPVGVFPILLLILMGAVIAFLLLVQNVDRFSRYFGGAAFKIVFDAALVTGLVLFAAYLYTRDAEYRRNLETVVERLQRSNTLLQVLKHIQSIANASLDTQGLLQESLEAAMPIVASTGAIYLFDEETSRLVPQACYGTHTSLRDLPSFALGEGIVGEVAKTGQPIEEKVGEGTVGPTGVARYAIAVKSGNKVMGVMVAGTPRGACSPEEKTL